MFLNWWNHAYATNTVSNYYINKLVSADIIRKSERNIKITSWTMQIEALICVLWANAIATGQWNSKFTHVSWLSFSPSVMKPKQNVQEALCVYSRTCLDLHNIKTIYIRPSLKVIEIIIVSKLSYSSYLFLLRLRLQICFSVSLI